MFQAKKIYEGRPASVDYYAHLKFSASDIPCAIFLIDKTTSSRK